MFGFRVARPLALALLLTGVSGCDRKTPDEVAPSPQARPAQVKFLVGIPAVGDRFMWSVEERGRFQLGNSANINTTAVIDVEVLAANEWDITSARVHVREHQAEFIDEAGVHTPMRSVVLGSTYLLSWTKDEPLRATHVERGAVTKDELLSLERFVASMRSHSLSARMLDGRSLEQGERLMPLPMEESVAEHKGKRRERRHDFVVCDHSLVSPSLGR